MSSSTQNPDATSIANGDGSSPRSATAVPIPSGGGTMAPDSIQDIEDQSATSASSCHSSDDSDSSIERDLQEERARPWPATFERSVALLAGPHLGVERDVDRMTRSPMRSVTPRIAAKQRIQQLRATGKPDQPQIVADAGQTFLRSHTLDYGTLPSKSSVETDCRCAQDHDQKQHHMRHDSIQDAKAYLQTIVLSQTGGTSSKLLQSSGGGEAKSLGVVRFDSTMYSPGMEREEELDRLLKEHRRAREGKASFAQCVLNMVNILLGLGMLGLPYVLRTAGWIGGLTIMIVFAAITYRTAILIGRSLNGDPRPLRDFDSPFVTPHVTPRLNSPLKSFPEIATVSFGEPGNVLLSTVLYFELFSCLAISLVTMGEHMNVIVPGLSVAGHKVVMAVALTLPTALLRTPRLISYLSAVGICAAVTVVLSVVTCALWEGDVTSALVASADRAATTVSGGTDLEAPYHMLWRGSGIPMSLGLSAYTFSGHATVPSIYVSMKDPRQFERMIAVSWSIVLSCSLAVAVSGYYMFGSLVHDQVTISLATLADGTAIDMLTALMVLNAFSTFTLCMYPLAIGIEELFDPMIVGETAKGVASHAIRFLLIALALLVAVFVPSFSFICTLVGLITTMTVSVIFPSAAYVKLFGEKGKLSKVEVFGNYTFFAFGLVSAIVGTYATCTVGGGLQ